MAEQFARIFQRHGGAALDATEFVDQLVARNAIDPGRKGQLGVLGRAPRMNGDQGFLHRILGRADVQAARKIASQMPGQARKQHPVGAGISH